MQTRLLTPPQAIIYTHDMEPITAIEMKPEYWRFLEKQAQIAFAVIPPFDISDYREPPHIPTIRVQQVRLYAHCIFRNDRCKYLMLTTEDEESALLMKSIFLPGQQKTLTDVKRKEFMRGLSPRSN